VRFSITMRSFSNTVMLEIVLDGGEKKERKIIEVRSKPAIWTLICELGGNSGVQIRCREGGRVTILLEEAFCEILD